MEAWSNWIYESLGITHTVQYDIGATLLIFLIVILLRKLFLRLMMRHNSDIKTRYNWIKSSSYISYIIILFFITPIWIKELHSFGTFFGLLSAGLAVALKDPISNFFAWIYIILKKPFEMGDRIQIGKSEGDILDISFFEFTLLEIKNWVEADQSTGRIVHVPNGLLFTQPVINYNQAMDYIWHEIPVMVTFESNWRKAKQILLDIERNKLKPLIKNAEPEFDKAKREYFVHYNNINPTVYTGIKSNGVLLTLRYLCPPKKRRDFEQTAFEEILNEFEKHPDIRFAYPTTRFYSVNEDVK